MAKEKHIVLKGKIAFIKVLTDNYESLDKSDVIAELLQHVDESHLDDFLERQGIQILEDGIRTL